MKSKKSLIFISLIILLFGVASVCASDVNQTSLANDESSTELNLHDADAISADDSDSSKMVSEEIDESVLGNDENLTGTFIEASDFNTVYKKADHLRATLKDVNGNSINNVSLKVNIIGVDSKNWPTNDEGQIMVPTQSLSVKTHDVDIIFGGNKKYASSSVTLKITVNKAESGLPDIDDQNLNYGEIVKFKVNPTGATGITAKINNSDVELNGNEIVIQKLNVGTYILSVTTIPDENHTAVTKTAKITVNKKPVSFTLNNLSLNYGATMIKPISATGAKYITATIDGKDLDVSDNKITISGFDAGNYKLSVTAVGDENHLTLTKNVTVTVNKTNSAIGIHDIDVNYGSSYNIDVNPSGAIALTADVDGESVKVNGYTIIIPVLDVGNHTLTVTTVPDKNHNSVINTSTITVSKVYSPFIIHNVTLDYGSKYNMTVTNDTSVKFTAKIDNDDVEIADNLIIFPKLNVGKHTLNVTSIADENHGSVSKTATITINKAKTSVKVSNLNATVDEKINLTAGMGSVDLVNEGMIIFFEGENKLGQAKVNNGIAKLLYTPSKVGTYSIFAIFDGTSSYESSNSTFTLTVLEKSKISNSSSNDSSDDNSTIVMDDGVINIPSLEGSSSDSPVEIKLPEDATGSITLTVDGKEYVFDVVNGISHINLPDLDNGDYSYTIKYSGDSKYSTFTKNGNVTVNNKSQNPGKSSNIKPEIKIPSLDSPLSDDGVPVTLPDDAKGEVILSIAGKNYVFEIVDGVSNVKFPELESGNYSFNITYSGDSKYASHTTNGNLKVDETVIITKKNSTSVTGNVKPDIKVPSLDSPSKDGSVDINLPSDAKGSVALVINGKNYVFDVVNGVAHVKLPELDDGSYSYDIKYSGDSKYSSFTQAGSLKVVNGAVQPADSFKISASNVKVMYAAGKYYTIKVYDADGKPADGVKVVIKVKGKTFKTLTAKKGVAKFKVTNKPGTYKMKISAVGKSVSKTLTVKHLISLKKVTVKKSAKKLTLQATLSKVNGKYLKNKKITFKFNGKKYTAKTNKNGVAKVTIKSSVLKKLKVGKKLTYQATYSKDTVKKTVVIKK